METVPGAQPVCHINTESVLSPHAVTSTNLDSDSRRLANAVIRYTIFPVQEPNLGWCLMAVSDFGLCALYFSAPVEGDEDDHDSNRDHHEQFLSQALSETWARINKRIKDTAQHAVLKRADAYLSGDRTYLLALLGQIDKTCAIGLRLHFIGTTFQLSVYHALLKVPHGQVVTYTKLLSLNTDAQDKDDDAAVAPKGRSAAPLAVGVACGSNDIALFVPCHRVVPTSSKGTMNDNSVGGYRWGSGVKLTILHAETNPTSSSSSSS